MQRIWEKYTLTIQDCWLLRSRTVCGQAVARHFSIISEVILMGLGRVRFSQNETNETPYQRFGVCLINYFEL